MSKNKYEEFRDGILSMNTRRFGTIPELMIKKLYNFDNHKSDAYDLFDSQNNKKVEVKFSTALKGNDIRITEKNVLDACMNENPKNRRMSSTETKNNNYDWNIQQVKLDEFDDLYYGVFFTDKIEIYKISSNDIPTETNYSDGQHRGNKGNEGQFHITPDNIAEHRKRKVKELTYEELYKLFEDDK